MLNPVCPGSSGCGRLAVLRGLWPIREAGVAGSRRSPLPEMGTSGTIVAAQGDCAVQEGRRRVHKESSTYQDLGRGVGRKQMQGGREPGRSVYTVRRILAALIVLLLLVLLVPQACQALLGTGSESGSGAPDTADVDGSGSEEEDAATVEEPADDTELAGQESTEEESAAESGSEDEHASTGANASEDSGEDEDEDVQNVEFDAALAQVDVELDAAVDGGVNQIAPVPVGPVPVGPVPVGPVPVVDLALQQEIQPIALGEPVVFEQPIVTQSPVPLEPPVIPAQPIIEQPILPEEPAFFGQPIPFEEPVFFEEEPAFFAEPAFYWEEPIFFEEPVVYDAGAPTVVAPTVETEVVQESAGEMQEGSSEASTVAIASGGGDRD